MRKVTPILISFLLLLAACGSTEATSASFDSTESTATDAAEMELSSDESESWSDDGAAIIETSDQDAAPKTTGPLGSGSQPITPGDAEALQPVDTGRDIIYTAEVALDVENLSAASQVALTRIESLGGLLFGQTTTTQGQRYTTLTFKVAPQDFQAALRALGEVGEIRDQNISASDVTDRIVDLESQIITAEASVLRLRGFLDKATDLTQVAQLEQELLQRETTLERLRGQVRTLENSVALATITVTMTEIIPGPAVSLVETAYLGHDAGTTCGGDSELRIDEGDAFTICLEINNSGDTYLSNIEVREEGLKLKTKDFTVIEGSLDGALAPGQSIVLFYEDIAANYFAGQSQVSAKSVDANGEALPQGSVSARSAISVNVIADDSLPGFVAGFESGWRALTGVVSAIVLGVGFILPLLPLIIVGWFVMRFVGRWLARRPKTTIAKQTTWGETQAQPPAPRPAPQTVGADSAPSAE